MEMPETDRLLELERRARENHARDLPEAPLWELRIDYEQRTPVSFEFWFSDSLDKQIIVRFNSTPIDGIYSEHVRLTIPLGPPLFGRRADDGPLDLTRIDELPKSIIERLLPRLAGSVPLFARLRNHQAGYAWLVCFRRPDQVLAFANVSHSWWRRMNTAAYEMMATAAPAKQQHDGTNRGEHPTEQSRVAGRSNSHPKIETETIAAREAAEHFFDHRAYVVRQGGPVRILGRLVTLRHSNADASKTRLRVSAVTFLVHGPELVHPETWHEMIDERFPPRFAIAQLEAAQADIA